MSPYGLLLQLSGLSLGEAAVVHDTRIDSVKSWSSGRRAAPLGVVQELRDLVSRQERAASESLAQLHELAARHGAPQFVELGYPTDDYEARQLGWPTVSAWRSMAARIVAAAPCEVRLVPRGSTVATAAAIQQHEG